MDTRKAVDIRGSQLTLNLGQLLQGVSTRLGTGRQLSFSHLESGQPMAVPSGAEAWTQGLLIAERMPLREVLEQLDRYRRGVLRCDPVVAGMQVSGSFSLDHPEASLDLLAQAASST